MKNPWKGSPLAVCATPIIGLLVQIIVLADGSARDTHLSAPGGLAANIEVVTAMLLPLVAFPALVASVQGMKLTTGRPWYFAGIVLNSVYAVFILILVLAVVTFLLHTPAK
ncbi:MAG TPA: hypothetical protein VFE25_01165 [Opitutaceae bacterium]|nr:hypothetical protein [Opitutaceae bacterium]